MTFSKLCLLLLLSTMGYLASRRVYDIEDIFWLYRESKIAPTNWRGTSKIFKNQKENEEIRRALETQREENKQILKALETQREENEEIREALETQRKKNEKIQEALETQREENEEIREALETQRKKNEKIQEASDAQQSTFLLPDSADENKALAPFNQEVGCADKFSKEIFKLPCPNCQFENLFRLNMDYIVPVRKPHHVLPSERSEQFF